MTKQDKVIELTRWIRSVLVQGLPLTEPVSEYMAATFGSEDLATIMAEDVDGELDSLLELIFFPDFDLQVRFESRWGDAQFSPNDLKKIQTRLHQAPPAAVVSPPAIPPVKIDAVPLFALDAFVQRLNIAWKPPSRLVNTLTNCWPENLGTRIRVHLRNTRIEWHAGQAQLVNQVLEKMSPDAADTETCLIFLLSILSELAPDTAPYDFLTAKKFFYFQSLCKAEDFERRRQTSNMEIMMLQGNRASHGSVAQWRQQMQWIDRICYALFERTQFFQHPDEQCIDLPSGDDAQMMQDIIRTLS